MSDDIFSIFNEFDKEQENQRKNQVDHKKEDAQKEAESQLTDRQTRV